MPVPPTRVWLEHGHSTRIGVTGWFFIPFLGPKME